MKDARNILLLKQKNYVAPFDIRHLSYQEYDPNNLKLLCSHIRSFLNERKTQNYFYEALCRNGIISYIDENNNEIIELLISKLTDSSLDCIIKLLSGEGHDISNEQIFKTFKEYQEIINQSIDEQNYTACSVLLEIFYSSLKSGDERLVIREQIIYILNDYFNQFEMPESLVREYKTKLVLLMAKHEKYMDIVLPWILDYFSRSKTATIDLNRYNVESYLMTTTSNKVNEAIINRLCDKDCYVREHMADIIGEKKLVESAPLLFAQLQKEENFFTAQSMMEAIGKIKQLGGIEAINSWVNIHKDRIIKTNQLFVLKHAFNALVSLDNSKEQLHVKCFNEEFGKILKDYFII